MGVEAGHLSERQNVSAFCENTHRVKTVCEWVGSGKRSSFVRWTVTIDTTVAGGNTH